MTETEILNIFKKSGVLLTGHFLLTSGRHSDRYFQCAKVLQYPEYTEVLCKMIAEVASDYMEICMIIGAWTATDSTAVDFDGSTTDSTHFMLVYTTGEARHKGVFSTNDYFLSVNGSAFDCSDSYVAIYGLQIEEVNSGSIAIFTVTSGGTSCKISDSMLRCNANGSTSSLINGSSATFLSVINCVCVNSAASGTGFTDSSASGSGSSL